MKFNAEWFYTEFKDAIRILDLSWGDHDKITIETNEVDGTITFKGNGRSLTVSICEEAK